MMRSATGKKTVQCAQANSLARKCRVRSWEPATILADQLAELLRLLMEAVPHATTFVRPGFDEPWR
jgi:hypothetical protein